MAQRGDRTSDMTATLDLWPIGNCQVSALIDRAGRFVWGCVPRVDGDPLFSSLLDDNPPGGRSEEHTSELQSLMRISYAVFCLKKKNEQINNITGKLTEM